MIKKLIDADRKILYLIKNHFSKSAHLKKAVIWISNPEKGFPDEWIPYKWFFTVLWKSAILRKKTSGAQSSKLECGPIFRLFMLKYESQ